MIIGKLGVLERGGAHAARTAEKGGLGLVENHGKVNINRHRTSYQISCVLLRLGTNNWSCHSVHTATDITLFERVCQCIYSGRISSNEGN